MTFQVDPPKPLLVQSVPTTSVTKVVTMIKSLTAREIFKRCPQVKNNSEEENSGLTATQTVQSGNTVRRI